MSEAWAGIIASLIAAIAATLGLVLAKESKTSEFRQIWISELRTLLTGYSSLMSSMNALGDGAKEDYEQKIKDISRYTSEIRLRLNFGNLSKNEQELLNKTYLLAGKVDEEHLSYLGLVKEFDIAAFNVLKEEWERVKKGELKYRVCLYSCVFIMMVCAMMAIIYIYFHFEVLVNALTR